MLCPVLFLVSFSRLERSKVRVSFFQSSQPQCVSPPDQVLFGDSNNNSYSELNNNNSTFGGVGGDLVDFTDDPEKMAAVVAHMHQQAHQTYDRQIRWVEAALIELALSLCRCWSDQGRGMVDQAIDIDRVNWISIWLAIIEGATQPKRRYQVVIIYGVVGTRLGIALFDNVLWSRVGVSFGSGDQIFNDCLPQCGWWVG